MTTLVRPVWGRWGQMLWYLPVTGMLVLLASREDWFSPVGIVLLVMSAVPLCPLLRAAIFAQLALSESRLDLIYLGYFRRLIIPIADIECLDATQATWARVTRESGQFVFEFRMKSGERIQCPAMGTRDGDALQALMNKFQDALKRQGLQAIPEAKGWNPEEISREFERKRAAEREAQRKRRPR